MGEVHPNSMGKGLRREKPSTGSRDGMGSLGIDFLPENSRDVAGNLGPANTVAGSLVPVDVLENPVLGLHWPEVGSVFCILSEPYYGIIAESYGLRSPWWLSW